MVNVTFYGVRGSTPCGGESTRRYGGNTSCVAVESPGHEPIICDLGTGLRNFGTTQPTDGSFKGTALVSHTHWDHIQGLPFFPPILAPGAEFDIYGPAQEDGATFADVFASFMARPLFPVTVDDLPGSVRFKDANDTRFWVGDAHITALQIPHCGVTNGYRIEWQDVTVAYLPDHQQPADGRFQLTPAARELCEGADLLVHDAQYTPTEFARKSSWGHCTVEFALWAARETGVERLALFHHDPSRDDDALDDIARCAESWGDKLGIEVITAREGLTVSVQ